MVPPRRHPPTCRSILGAALAVVCALSLGGCGEVVAWVDRVKVVMLARTCAGLGDRDLQLAVGDSLVFQAQVRRSRPGSNEFSLFGKDGTLLYTSDRSPHAFRWSLRYPPRSTHRLKWPERGAADLSSRGVLRARAPGLVYVTAWSAGARGEVKVSIVPRVARFAVHPREAALRPGDSLSVRAEVGLAGPSVSGHFGWIVPGELDGNEGGRLVARAEQDPDGPRRDDRDLRLVAERPGVTRLRACFTSARSDTVTVRITGDPPPPPPRDVPPALRLRPTDSAVYAGERFRARLRLLNAALGNGPWRWHVDFGDGTTVDGGGAYATTSAFGFEVGSWEHAYRAEGAHVMTATVADAAGRTTTVRTPVAALAATPTVQLLPDTPATGRPTVRLGDGRRDLPIVILSSRVPRVSPSEVMWLASHQREAGLPVLRIGRTEYEYEHNHGFGTEIRDVNGDGDADLIIHVDKQALIRNGDLRPGRNRLLVTGALSRMHSSNEPPLYTPFRGVAEFDAVP